MTSISTDLASPDVKEEAHLLNKTIIDQESDKLAWTYWDYVNVFFIKPRVNYWSGIIILKSQLCINFGQILYQEESAKVGDHTRINPLD